MYDLIIRGGMVYDGTGAAPIRADVAVTNGVVTTVGDARGCAAQMVGFAVTSYRANGVGGL